MQPIRDGLRVFRRHSFATWNPSVRAMFCSHRERSNPMERMRYFVDRGDREWYLTKEGATAPMERFKTKRQAVRRGREIARGRKPSQLVVKGKNHVIQNEWTYGGDPERFPG